MCFWRTTDSVFGIIMILFAGGWSDKRGKRKPCMLIPLLGELAALIGKGKKFKVFGGKSLENLLIYLP